MHKGIFTLKKSTKTWSIVAAGVVILGVTGALTWQHLGIQVQVKASEPVPQAAASKTATKPIPKFNFQTPNTYTTAVQEKIIKLAPTAREVLFYNNSTATTPTEQVYIVNPETDQWQVAYTNTLTKLQGEYLDQTDTASLGPHTYVVDSMWSADMGGSQTYEEVVVVDTQQDKVLYENDYQHELDGLNNKLFILTPSQSKPIIQQNAVALTPIPKKAVAVVGETSGNVLYLYKDKVQDVAFTSQSEAVQLALPSGNYAMVTPSSDLSTIAEIQGNYESLTGATYSSPETLTVKAGSRIVFNDISQDQYAVYTNMWNQGQVNTSQSDMVNGGVSPTLQPGLWTFLMQSNNSTGNQGVILQVHVIQ